MTEIRNYEDLKVWQKAIALTDLIYDATERFPRDELFGLTNQIRRSAVSVASNIAEGSARGSRKDLRKETIVLSKMLMALLQSLKTQEKELLSTKHQALSTL